MIYTRYKSKRMHCHEEFRSIWVDESIDSWKSQTKKTHFKCWLNTRYEITIIIFPYKVFIQDKVPELLLNQLLVLFLHVPSSVVKYLYLLWRCIPTSTPNTSQESLYFQHLLLLIGIFILIITDFIWNGSVSCGMCVVVPGYPTERQRLVCTNGPDWHLLLEPSALLSFSCWKWTKRSKEEEICFTVGARVSSYDMCLLSQLPPLCRLSCIILSFLISLL